MTAKEARDLVLPLVRALAGLREGQMAHSRRWHRHRVRAAMRDLGAEVDRLFPKPPPKPARQRRNYAKKVGPPQGWVYVKNGIVAAELAMKKAPFRKHSGGIAAPMWALAAKTKAEVGRAKSDPQLRKTLESKYRLAHDGGVE